MTSVIGTATVAGSVVRGPGCAPCHRVMSREASSCAARKQAGGPSLTPQFPERHVGCTGFPADSHDTIWMTVNNKLKNHRCPECGCGEWSESVTHSISLHLSPLFFSSLHLDSVPSSPFRLAIGARAKSGVAYRASTETFHRDLPPRLSAFRLTAFHRDLPPETRDLGVESRDLRRTHANASSLHPQLPGRPGSPRGRRPPPLSGSYDRTGGVPLPCAGVTVSAWGIGKSRFDTSLEYWYWYGLE